MKVKFKKLSEAAQAPKKAHNTDAGFDLFATSKAKRDLFIEYGTSLSFEIPEGYVGLLFPRSSVSNKALTLANSVGVVDSDFRGEVRLRFRKTPGAGPEDSNVYQIGDKIGQLVVIELPKVELEEIVELSVTERGEGGFGSTDVDVLLDKIVQDFTDPVLEVSEEVFEQIEEELNED